MRWTIAMMLSACSGAAGDWSFVEVEGEAATGYLWIDRDGEAEMSVSSSVLTARSDLGRGSVDGMTADLVFPEDLVLACTAFDRSLTCEIDQRGASFVAELVPERD